MANPGGNAAEMNGGDPEIGRQETPRDPLVKARVLSPPADQTVRSRQREHLILSPRLSDGERLDKTTRERLQVTVLPRERIELGKPECERTRRLDGLNPGHRRCPRAKVDTRASHATLGHEDAGVFVPRRGHVELADEALLNHMKPLGARAAFEEQFANAESALNASSLERLKRRG
jgi:hypothetical protein